MVFELRDPKEHASRPQYQNQTLTQFYIYLSSLIHKKSRDRESSQTLPFPFSSKKFHSTANAKSQILPQYGTVQVACGAIGELIQGPLLYYFLSIWTDWV